MSETSPQVVFELQDAILRIELARPEKKNALSDVLLEQLNSGVEYYLQTETVRAIVISGQSGNFCAGRDLNDEIDSKDLAPSELVKKYTQFSQQMAKFANIPLPKIALIEGHAIGAGWVLAALCDLRYATNNAQFSIPEMNLGFPFGMNGTARLVQHMGLARAAELVFSGRKFSATEAQSYGFLSNTKNLDFAESEALAMAQKISQRPAFVLEQTVRELQDAAESLVHVDGANVASMVIATLDHESQALNDSYSSKFTRNKETVS